VARPCAFFGRWSDGCEIFVTVHGVELSQLYFFRKHSSSFNRLGVIFFCVYPMTERSYLTEFVFLNKKRGCKKSDTCHLSTMPSWEGVKTCHNSGLSQMFEIYWHAFARSEVLVATLMESRNLRDVTLCRMVNSCLHLESPSICRRKDGGRKPIWNWVILSFGTARIPGHLNIRTDLRQFLFSFSLFLSQTAFSRPV